MNEDKATRYHRLQRRAAVMSIAMTAVGLVLIVCTGLSLTVRSAADRLARLVPLPTAVEPWTAVTCYVVALFALHELFAFPLAFYRGFLLEHRYHLSSETAGAWLRDHLKAVLVALMLAILASSLVYGSLRNWPSLWWAIAAAGCTLATILLANLAPVLLFPIFYRLEPIRRESLRSRLMWLAERAGADVLGVYEWTLGDRTRRANAVLVGIGRTRRILLSDTILAQYSDDEIEVILAHELAHHVHRDIWRAIACEAALMFAGFFLAHRALLAFAPAAGLRGIADVAGLPILLLSAGAIAIVFVPVANGLSRSHERRADRYALDLTRKPGAFVSAMRRLGVQNLAEGHPSRIVEVLFYGHPPLVQRIATAHEWVREMNPAASQEEMIGSRFAETG